MAALQRPISLINNGDLLLSSSYDHLGIDLSHDCRTSAANHRSHGQASSSSSSSSSSPLRPPPSQSRSSRRAESQDATADMDAYYQPPPASRARYDAPVYTTHVPVAPSPPPAPPLPALSCSDARDAECQAAKGSTLKSSADSAALKPCASLSEWCASMVCYIWFAGYTPEPSPAVITPCRSPTTLHAPVQSSPLARRHRKQESLGSLSECSSFSAHDLSQAMEAHLRSNAEMTRRNGSVSKETTSDPLSLRLCPRPRFKAFVRDMLNTTQVSKSVIILALLYIHRLKSRHPGLHGQEGSEFRLFVTALMLANKFLDDHTYTNKTWSELSGIELKDVTKMEVEFWLGLSMSIYVSDVDFRHWIRTLENLAERRQHAITRREQELSRKAVLQHQQNLYLQQQQQQQHIQHQQQQQQQQHQRRLVQQARHGQTQPWSPESYYSDDVRSPYGPSTPLYPALPVSPSSARVVDFLGRPAHMDMGGPFHFTVPDNTTPEMAWVNAQAQRPLKRQHTPDSSGFDGTFPRPPSSSYADLAVGVKRPYGSSLQHDVVSNASPERPSKRMAAYSSKDRSLRSSLSPLDSAHYRRAARGVSSERAHVASPISVQHYPRSVFEPLVTTPNTLLAPFQGIQQQRPHPLAYWQLAAGHDRGIKGVHLPPQRTTLAYVQPYVNAPFNNAEGSYVDPFSRFI